MLGSYQVDLESYFLGLLSDMELNTYPRLNLRSKRIGMEADDIIWLLSYGMASILFQSVLLTLATVMAVYYFYAFYKPSKPRGYFAAKLYYYLRPHYSIAALELRSRLLAECGLSKNERGVTRRGHASPL